jgi:hypothetical protein
MSDEWRENGRTDGRYRMSGGVEKMHASFSPVAERRNEGHLDTPKNRCRIEVLQHLTNS